MSPPRSCTLSRCGRTSCPGCTSFGAGERWPDRLCRPRPPGFPWCRARRDAPGRTGHVTGPEVADCLRTSSFERAVALGDAALGRGLSREELLSCLALAGRTGALLRPAGRPSSSTGGPRASVSPSAGCCWLACAFRDRTCSSRSPTTPDACFARSDFHRSKQRTLGEFDGKTKYGRSMQPGKDPGDVVFHEKVREDRLREMGFEVVRWIWDDLQRPNVLEQRFAPRARPWFSPLRASVPAHPR